MHDSKQAWLAAGLQHIVMSRVPQFATVKEVLVDVVSKVDRSLAGQFATLLWNNGNNSVWNDTKEAGRQLGIKAQCMWNDWWAVLEIRNQHYTIEVETLSWHKPEMGWYKCNIDASFDKNMGKTSVGWCVQDYIGRFIAAVSSWVHGNFSIIEGEVMTFDCCCQTTIELRLH
ncbi:cytochrome p450 [Trifolium pratense]|uniref:Cytochrome p450 n=1 Tax=Trifolium pratense TaxID=57577 RepID=A0A2K3MW79_TRIPR|nr:cytochrome p450 [Trifolium pratense]